MGQVERWLGRDCLVAGEGGGGGSGGGAPRNDNCGERVASVGAGEDEYNPWPPLLR